MSWSSLQYAVSSAACIMCRAAQRNLVRQLRGFVDEVGPEWQALPSASARAASFQMAAEALVYDALMLRVSSQQCVDDC